MKIKYFIAVAAFALMQYGCDKVDAPYREEVVAPDFCSTGIDDSIPNKKVLVEDYTGHGCGNCPDAGIYLNDTLKPLYNHCLVVISVHAGFFAGTCPNALVCLSMPNPPAGSFETDFNTVPGSAWNTFFGISGNPKGMVDRIDYPNGSHSKTYNAWGPAIATELEKDAKAKIKISNSFNQASNSVNVSVESEFVDNLQGDYKLQVVITEDSLIDWQLWYNHQPDEYVPDYIHRHVLRDGLNTTWGETISTGAVAKGTIVTKNYNYTINSSWNVNHCNIVAFIYDDATKEVLQVEEQPVK
jgi:hypothetical protein